MMYVKLSKKKKTLLLLTTLHFIRRGLPLKHTMAFEITEDGEILQTLHDPDGELTWGLSQVTTLKDGRLVLGSFRANWLAFTKDKIEAIGKS